MDPASPADDPSTVPATGRVFRGTARVRLGDVRPSGRLRLDAAARLLQDVSADDTADAALPDASHWVVRRTTVEVRWFPRYLEALDLATWCSGVGSHFAERRVSIVGDQGGRIEATTLWVHVEPSSGRPRRLGDGFHELYGPSAGGRRVTARLQHPEPPSTADRRPWPLRATDLDVLAHVNNAAYWEVVEEALAERGGARAPMRAEVEHRIAAEPDDVVEWVVADGDAGLAVWILADGSVAASARIELATP